MIDAYVDELARELAAAGVRGRPARRLLAETRAHLAEAAAGAGEAAAVASFGEARTLARLVASDLANARTQRATWAGIASLALAGAVCAALFVTLPRSGVDVFAGAVPGLALAASAASVFLPQVSFVAGTLALVRALRHRRATAPAPELAVVQRRMLVALAAGGLTLLSLAALAATQRAGLPGWWTTAAVAGLVLLLPLAAAAVGIVHARRPAAFPGGRPATALDDVAAVAALLPACRRFPLPASPAGLAAAVAVCAGAGVALAGVAASDPIDGALRGVLEAAAVLGCYRVLGRVLALR